MSRYAVALFLAVLFAGSRAEAGEVTLDRVRALAKTYFRDSAERPMDVAVSTVVTDKAGKTRRSSQATARMLFSGYGLQGHLTVNASSSIFKTWALRDSLSADTAVFDAPLFLMPDWKPEPAIEPAAAGAPAVITGAEKDCAPFQLMPPAQRKYLFPFKPCGSRRFTLTETPSGELRFGRYSFDAAGLPAPVNTAYLGTVQMQTFHVDIDFQEMYLPGDPKPHLWPKQATVLAGTDKGRISITTRYSPRLGAKK